MATGLNRSYADALALPFVRTAGDEMQGVASTGDGLARIASRCLEDGGWWVGVGLGPIELPLGPTARDTRGPAFWNAREAVKRAHKQKGGAPGPIAVVGEERALADSVEAALSALAFIVGKRSARQQQAVDLARAGRSQRAVAEDLGITVSAVSQLLRASGFDEQRRLEALVARLCAEEVV